MDASKSVISNEKQKRQFPIEQHERQDFAKHLRKYGWSIRGSVTQGPFEVISPGGDQCLNANNLLQFFKEEEGKEEKYTKIVEAFVRARSASAKKKKRRRTVQMISISDVMGNTTPKHKSSVLEVPPKTAPKRKRVKCVWPGCSNMSTYTNKRNEPRCDRHRYKNPCEIANCDTPARGGGQFPHRCEAHGGGWRCAHPECNRVGTQKVGGIRTCPQHKNWSKTPAAANDTSSTSGYSSESEAEARDKDKANQNERDNAKDQAGPPETEPKRKRTNCSWRECSSSSVSVNKKNEPRCDKHRYSRPCEMDGCTSEARTGGDFPNRCEGHGGGWRCEHPECNKPGRRGGSGKRTCSAHHRWAWHAIAEESSSSSEEEAGERRKGTATDSEGKDDSTSKNSEDSGVSTSASFEIEKQRKDAAVAETKDKDDSTSKSTEDSGVNPSTSSEIEKQRKDAAVAETKDKDDSTSKNEDNVQRSVSAPDTLSSLTEAQKHTKDCIEKVMHCKRRTKELEVQLEEAKNSNNDNIRNKKDMLAARVQARDKMNRQKVRVKNMEQHFKTAEEAFQKALVDTAGVGRLASCHNNVSQCLKDLTEVKLELYKLEENLSNHEHTLAALKPRFEASQGKVTAAEQVLSESKTEFKAASASLRKARDQEAKLVDALLAEC